MKGKRVEHEGSVVHDGTLTMAHTEACAEVCN